MGDDLYDDGGGMNSPAVSENPSEQSEESDGAPESLLPKSFFGDKELEPGKRCEVEIVRVEEDQVLVKKVPESEYSSNEEEAPPRGEMESMMD